MTTTETHIRITTKNAVSEAKALFDSETSVLLDAEWDLMYGQDGVDVLRVDGCDDVLGSYAFSSDSARDKFTGKLDALIEAAIATDADAEADAEAEVEVETDPNAIDVVVSDEPPVTDGLDDVVEGEIEAVQDAWKWLAERAATEGGCSRKAFMKAVGYNPKTAASQWSAFLASVRGMQQAGLPGCTSGSGRVTLPTIAQ